MNTIINLMGFGLNTLNYKNDKSVVRYFISKFNSHFNFQENNCTGTVAELILFSNTSSKAELKAWAVEKMQEHLSASLGANITRETFELATPTTPTRTHVAETTTTETTTVETTTDGMTDQDILDIIGEL